MKVPQGDTAEEGQQKGWLLGYPDDCAEQLIIKAAGLEMRLISVQPWAYCQSEGGKLV